jgi:hypothetical protein
MNRLIYLNKIVARATVLQRTEKSARATGGA